MLVLPDHKILSLPVLQKIDQLVQAGATVSGAKPLRTASLTGAPESEAQLHILADGLWGESPAAQGRRTVGKGTVFWGTAAKEILKDNGIPVDCSWDGDADAFGFIHRQTDSDDIYFLSNRNEEAVQAVFSFRITNKQPEFWDPLSGAIRDAEVYAATDNAISIPIAFAPYGALFVVFRKPWRAPTGTNNFSDYRPVYELKGPWTIAFDPQWASPAVTEVPRLQCWTQHVEADIRHYSGAATYTKRFDMPEVVIGMDTTLLLDLGTVHEIASVRLNGKTLGVLWTPPFQAEVTHVLKETDNLLEIDVVNNWANRLIGDAGLPEAQRRTSTNVTKFRPDMSLTPSGLLGPVRLLAGI